MLLRDTHRVQGTLTIELTKGDGTKESIDLDNLVVSTGLNYVVNRLKENAVTPMSHIGVGAGTATPESGDTTLGTQLGRVGVTSITVVNNAITYAATFAPGVATGAITEAGIFNAATDGVMFSRTVFPVINKQAADTMSITWTATFNDAGV